MTIREPWKVRLIDCEFGYSFVHEQTHEAQATRIICHTYRYVRSSHLRTSGGHLDHLSIIAPDSPAAEAQSGEAYAEDISHSFLRYHLFSPSVSCSILFFMSSEGQLLSPSQFFLRSRSPFGRPPAPRLSVLGERYGSHPTIRQLRQNPFHLCW